MPLLEENNFLPDFNAIPPKVAVRAKLMWLNYPNNPTGAIATPEFFKDAVDFAKQYHILVAHDAPYADVCFDGYHAPSILEVPGAMDVCVEFNSLSKTYNMAGWRLGMTVGNAQVIRYLSTYKSQVDSSHFQPILAAGIEAMTGDQTWLEERNAIYQKRRDIVLKAVRDAGLYVHTPPAAIYVWVKLPKGQGSIDFCDRLLDEAGVSTTPGIVYGEYGEGFMRISLGSPTDQIEKAMQLFSDWMKN
jgi:LL-diaminopimelate aminotransferase